MVVRRSTIRLGLLWGLRGAAVGIALTSTIAEAVSLSGTVQYTGTHGPVSATRSILMFLWTTPSPVQDQVAQTSVTSNGGTFDLEAPTSGTFYLAFELDLNGDGRASVGEPFQVFNGRPDFPGDPIVVPQSGVTLSFADTGALSGIAGTVTYAGTHGPVFHDRRLIVQDFRDRALTDGAGDFEHGVTNASRYDLLTLDTNTYYLRAFLDLNNNRGFDPGEPFAIYNHKGVPPGDGVVAGPSRTGVDITFGDENITPAGTPTPTPPAVAPQCVGDCDGSGEVTVDELITMVNIALGSSPLSACLAGDADGSGDITIDEIITAVNNALTECVPPVPTATPITHTVLVGPDGTFAFSPADMTISVGETVEWMSSSGGHNVVSGSDCVADGQFCSPNDSTCDTTPTSAPGATYSHTFTTAGTYPYFCSVHCGFGMVGTITVQ